MAAQRGEDAYVTVSHATLRGASGKRERGVKHGRDLIAMGEHAPIDGSSAHMYSSKP